MQLGIVEDYREKCPIGEIAEKLVILEKLDQGLYAQEIFRTTSYKIGRLSKIINSLKLQGYITMIQAYPKLYQLTKLGKLFLANGEPEVIQVQNEIKEKNCRPDLLKKLRVHKLRFKNKLYRKPSWLYKFQHEGRYNGIKIKVVNMKNWVKHILEFHYNDFNGLEKIEVCNSVIIYNFNRIKEEQYKESKESLQNYLQDRIQDCKEARTFLVRKGFEIDPRDPEFCQKPHFAVETFGTPGMLGSLGQYMNITMKTLEEVREIDDSPDTDGEEETDNMEKAVAIFDIPQQLEDLKKDNQELRNNIKELTRTLTNLANGNRLDNRIHTKDNSGDMYQ